MTDVDKPNSELIEVPARFGKRCLIRYIARCVVLVLVPVLSSHLWGDAKISYMAIVPCAMLARLLWSIPFHMFVYQVGNMGVSVVLTGPRGNTPTMLLDSYKFPAKGLFMAALTSLDAEPAVGIYDENGHRRFILPINRKDAERLLHALDSINISEFSKQ